MKPSPEIEARCGPARGQMIENEQRLGCFLRSSLEQVQPRIGSLFDRFLCRIQPQFGQLLLQRLDAASGIGLIDGNPARFDLEFDPGFPPQIGVGGRIQI